MSSALLIVKSSQTKAFLVGFLGLGFVALGCWLVRTGPVLIQGIGWLFIAFFGSCSAIAFWKSTRKRDLLEVRTSSLVVLKSRSSPKEWRWEEIECVVVSNIHGTKILSVVPTKAAEQTFRPTRMQLLNQGLFGFLSIVDIAETECDWPVAEIATQISARARCPIVHSTGKAQ